MKTVTTGGKKTTLTCEQKKLIHLLEVVFVCFEEHFIAFEEMEITLQITSYMTKIKKKK